MPTVPLNNIYPGVLDELVKVMIFGQADQGSSIPITRVKGAIFSVELSIVARPKHEELVDAGGSTT